MTDALPGEGGAIGHNERAASAGQAASPLTRARRPGAPAGRRPLSPHSQPDPHRFEDVPRSGPSVVALGGGHGLATALAAVRRYAGSITAVVSVADNGGSSGQLRETLGIPAPGDLRRCLVALAGEGASAGWVSAFGHRFDEGELAGHALGNLVIAGMADFLGDFERAIEEAGRLLDVVGQVYPASAEPVGLRACVAGVMVEGQVAVAASTGPIERVELVPGNPAACAGAIQAIELAEQVVLAPGSLFTSLLPALLVPEIRAAVEATAGSVVQVCNLHPQKPETDGLDGTDHLRALRGHGVRVDTLLYQEAGALAVDEAAVAGLGARAVAGDVGGRAARSHDPARLATALRALL